MLNANETDGYDRRKFIYDTSLTSLSFLFLSMLTGGCEDAFSQIGSRPMRRMIRNNTAANQAVDLYRTAVRAMKNLYPNDRRNWTRQAEIHLNYCPHGNWFFFPWHRAYLFQFEKICQRLTGDPTFGLPYWNWCMTGSIPAAYWPPPANNALYPGDGNRVATSSSVANPAAVGLSVVDAMCNEPDFTLFAGGNTNGLRPEYGPQGSYGNIERGPHNYIHGFVRGFMGGFRSPLDPIFWNHHCMVDLCWYEWSVTRNHANTNDLRWKNFDMSGNFCDENGNAATDLTVLATLLMPILSYQYETGIDATPAVMKEMMKNKADLEKMKTIIQEGSSVELKKNIQVPLKRAVEFSVSERPLSETIPADLRDFSAILSGTSSDRILLSIKNMTQPAANDVFIRVFVNKPDANPQTPIDDPHYAGSFYFFTHASSDHHGPHPKPDFIVDITKTLKQLQSTEKMDNFKGGVMINLVAVPITGVAPETKTLRIGDLELFTSPVVLKLMDLK
jgi:tyrosinase